MNTNPEIELARRVVEETDCHLFLTGRAGTGKTTFLRSLVQESRKRLVVLAPTGIAAVNAGGATIHSFFQITPGAPYIPDANYKEYAFNKRKIKLRFIFSVKLEIFFVNARIFCNFGNGADGRFLRDFNIT